MLFQVPGMSMTECLPYFAFRGAKLFIDVPPVFSIMVCRHVAHSNWKQQRPRDQQELKRSFFVFCLLSFVFRFSHLFGGRG